MFPGLRYPFRKPRGALIVVEASSHRIEHGVFTPDQGHQVAVQSLVACCEERGFTLVQALQSDRRPTADAIRKLFDEVAEMNFDDYDALMVVIASHGHEGAVMAWPEDGKDEMSGPVELREDVFRKFQLPQHSRATVPTNASRTLAGKPKIFLVDACRGAQAMHNAQYPLHTAVDAGGSVFDGLNHGDPYRPPLDPNGAPTNREADFFFAYATVPFNTAGVSDTGSVFLSSFAEQMRSNPRSSFVELINATNGSMMLTHGRPGKVRKTCYPQCCQAIGTLSKSLYFHVGEAQPIDPSDEAVQEIRDLLFATDRTYESDPDSDAAHEMEQARRDLLLHFQQFQAQAKRKRGEYQALSGTTRGESAPDGVTELAAAIQRLAQLESPSDAVTLPTLIEACSKLSLAGDNTLSSLGDSIPVLRKQLDELSSSQPPQIRLLAPSFQHQAATRSSVLRALPTMSDDDDDDEDDDSAATSGSNIRHYPTASRSWTSVRVGEKLKLEFTAAPGTRGFFYLLHLSDNDSEFKVAFPNKRDTDNRVPEDGVLRIPSRYDEAIESAKEENMKRWLYFTGTNLERESFYLITSSQRLDKFPQVGDLPANMTSLPPKQARAIVVLLKRHALGSRLRALPTMEDNDDDAINMMVSSFKLISVAE